jgi:hypothetical protein
MAMLRADVKLIDWPQESLDVSSAGILRCTVNKTL